jgi:molecular chaperone GrpE (heat shock protein)
VDGLTAALGTRLDVAVEAVKRETDKAVSRLAAQIQQSHDELQAAHVRELTSQIAALGDPLRAIEAEVGTIEERTSQRQEGAIASLREAIGNELSAASRRSSDADQALARSLTQLRWTSYALLALLTALATALLVITAAS